MFKTTDNGFNWLSIGDNLPFLNEISKILIHNNYLFIATSNEIWKRPMHEIITGITLNTVENPSGFHLDQNYPNPFNPVTHLEFVIPSVAGGLEFVSLKVYDVPENKVATLVNERLNPGRYKVEFSAKGGGREFPGGIYFYILNAGELTDTRSMILLK